MMFSRELYVIVDDVTLGLPKSIKGRALVITRGSRSSTHVYLSSLGYMKEGVPGPVHTYMYILQRRLFEGFEIQSQLI